MLLYICNHFDSLQLREFHLFTTRTCADHLIWQGDKNIIKFDGDHNSPRPQFYFDSVNIFFHNILQPPEDEVGAAFSYTSDDYFGKVVKARSFSYFVFHF